MSVCALTCILLFVNLWTVAHQAFLSMEFSRQGYQSELPFSPAGDLPDPVIKTTSLVSPSLAGRFFTNGATWEAHIIMFRIIIYYLCFYSVG